MEAHAFVRLFANLHLPGLVFVGFFFFFNDKSKYNAGKKPAQLVSVQIISFVSDLAVI